MTSSGNCVKSEQKCFYRDSRNMMWFAGIPDNFIYQSIWCLCTSLWWLSTTTRASLSENVYAARSTAMLSTGLAMSDFFALLIYNCGSWNLEKRHKAAPAEVLQSLRTMGDACIYYLGAIPMVHQAQGNGDEPPCDQDARPTGPKILLFPTSGQQSTGQDSKTINTLLSVESANASVQSC